MFHAHLTIKLCLVNMLEIVPGIGDIWQWRQQVADMTLQRKKAVGFNLVTIAALFAAENLWLLPKADFVRVLAEALGLLGIAILDYY